MPLTPYSGRILRPLTDKLGERVSVFDFGAAGDGATDDAPAFNAAIASANDKGRGVEIYAPGAIYALASRVEFPSGGVPIKLAGDGLATMFKRTGTLAAGSGLFDVQGGTDIEFRSFVLDGDVTTSAGVLYSTVAGDPMLAALCANTSFWIHEGSKRIRFRGVTVQHTGGYGVLIDCAAGLIEDVRILDCLFQNNRPHLFGTSGGDLNYGSWTGGVYVHGDGRVYGQERVLRDFLVQGCTFRRNTGNCLWAHLLGLDELHSNFRWAGNHFEDIGLDGMLVGGVSGGVVEGNTVRRNGYICSDDTSASTPKYLAGAYSVGLDTSGLVKGVAYKGNSFTSPNGAAMDLDGYADGVVSGNVARVPVSGEPEYTEDQIATTGPGGAGNVSYGAQISNSNNHAVAGSGVTIVGNTFLNLAGGAVRLYAARNSHVSGNQILHPAGASVQPIVMGNIGAGANQRAYGNVVTQNRIDYSPASPAACVLEDANGSAFSGTDVNWVFGNFLTGNGKAFEFLKDANTGSVTQGIQTTQAVASDVSETIVERQGSGTGSLTRWYGREGTTKRLLSSLHHTLFNSTPSAIGGPLFNVADDGAPGTGSFSTGGRTTLAFDDAMAAGRGVYDAFAALTDSTLSYPDDAAADLLPDTWGLLRYNSSTKIFEQSRAVSAGHRVWSSLGVPGGSSGHVQYNSSGAFGGSANFAWDNGAQLLTVTAANSSTAGIACATGYIQSDAGFYATLATATSYQSIQAPGGGVYGKSLRALNYTQIGNSAGTPTVTTGDTFVAGALFWDTTAAGLKIYNGSAWVGVGGVTSLNSLTGALTIAGTANQVVVTPAGSTITLSTPQDIGTSSNVAFLSLTINGNSIVSSAGAIQSPVTGASIAFQTANTNFQVDGNGNISGAGSVNLTGGSSAYKMGGTTVVDVSRNAAFLSLAINGSAIVSSSGAIQSPVTGASIAFQTSNTNFQVDGNGNISGAGSVNLTGGSSAYQMGGTTVVDVSRNASFLSLTINSNSIINSAGAIQSPVTGASIAFQTANTNFQVDGNGNISGAGSVNMATSYQLGGATVLDGGGLESDYLPEQASALATGQTGSVGASNLRRSGVAAPLPAGLYNVVIYMVTVTAGSAGSATIHLTYHDGVRSWDLGLNVLNLAGNFLNNVAPGSVRLNGSTDLQWYVSAGGITGSPVYDVYVAVYRVAD
jgi:hypothetical protein